MVVKRRNLQSAVLPIIALSSLIVLDSCNEEDINPKFTDDLLIGDWQVTEIDGQSTAGYDYSIILKFQAAGDLDFCIEGTYNNLPFSYCDNASWRWADANQAAVIVTDSDSEESTADIVSLTATNMEVNISYDYDGQTETMNWKFIRVD